MSKAILFIIMPVTILIISYSYYQSKVNVPKCGSQATLNIVGQMYSSYLNSITDDRYGFVINAVTHGDQLFTTENSQNDIVCDAYMLQLIVNTEPSEPILLNNIKYNVKMSDDKSSLLVSIQNFKIWDLDNTATIYKWLESHSYQHK
ncbi:hypothetical protein [Aquella oligotrophica]|uniref:Uncharacterized protein n=1 Tax=Aquella oligotrophica TaxID=2067065 RepID=A0A2I7N962_9NEIS|nr:hypothetical protein [Aquella oligotrophica]AUR52989.1 hypothetical protein CUN60_12030 [Aquella oligotrophica]